MAATKMIVLRELTAYLVPRAVSSQFLGRTVPTRIEG
jgi:hypothetical protein